MHDKESPDYFRIDELLTNEERKFRDVVRGFVDEFVYAGDRGSF